MRKRKLECCVTMIDGKRAEASLGLVQIVAMCGDLQKDYAMHDYMDGVEISDQVT